MDQFTDPEIDLIHRYQAERSQVEKGKQTEQRVAKQNKSRKKFYIFISVLAIAPFIIAGIFAYDASKINDTLNVSGFNQLRKSLSSKNYSTLSNRAGLQPVATAANTYNHRYAIIGIIFAVFLLLIVFTVIGRIVSTQMRSNHG